jgi:hypothetical protein
MSPNYSRIDDMSLIIEIVRRLRNKPIPNIDYIAYPGVDTQKVLIAASHFFEGQQLRKVLQKMIDDGSILCWGRRTPVNMDTDNSFSVRTKSGIFKWFHPDVKPMVRQWFTPTGTSLSEQKVKAGRKNKSPMVLVGIKHLYVTEDGLPQTIQTDVRLKRIIFDQTTFPMNME